MLLGITLKITPKMSSDAQNNQDRSLVGHLGTHFDVMDKEFPLEYTRRQGIAFDVSAVQEREITAEDIDLKQVEAGMFVAFYSGYIERMEYGTKAYFAGHPQLAHELIDALLGKGVSIIGMDCGGIRRGKEHVPADQCCADRNCFVIENLCNLKLLAEHRWFVVHTYPMNFAGITGLPCRVIAEI